MNKLIGLFLIGLVFASCSNNSQNKQQPQTEQAAVEDQLKKDQAMMDSLEKAIQAQINETDSGVTQ